MSIKLLSVYREKTRYVQPPISKLVNIAHEVDECLVLFKYLSSAQRFLPEQVNADYQRTMDSYTEVICTWLSKCKSLNHSFFQIFYKNLLGKIWRNHAQLIY